ncbi:MAG: hypothetical protein OHK0017_10880 [Patescibacteria group bacterium]
MANGTTLSTSSIQENIKDPSFRELVMDSAGSLSLPSQNNQAQQDHPASTESVNTLLKSITSTDAEALGALKEKSAARLNLQSLAEKHGLGTNALSEAPRPETTELNLATNTFADQLNNPISSSQTNGPFPDPAFNSVPTGFVPMEQAFLNPNIFQSQNNFSGTQSVDTQTTSFPENFEPLNPELLNPNNFKQQLSSEMNQSNSVSELSQFAAPDLQSLGVQTPVIQNQIPTAQPEITQPQNESAVMAKNPVSTADYNVKPKEVELNNLTYPNQKKEKTNLTNQVKEQEKQAQPTNLELERPNLLGRLFGNNTPKDPSSFEARVRNIR